jgi:hypothetical protein
MADPSNAVRGARNEWVLARPDAPDDGVRSDPGG